MHGLEAEVCSSPVSSAKALELDGREAGVPPTVLPSVENHRAAFLPSTDPQIVAAEEPGALRVLIADDSTTTRRFLRAVLEHSPQFDVAGEAGDGDSAVKMAKQLQPDLVLLDLAMPKVHGTSTLSAIRVAAPNTTVIVVSGMDPVLEEPVLEAGAIAFVPKGVAPLDFLERLGGILHRSLNADRRDLSEPIQLIPTERNATRSPAIVGIPRAAG